MKDWDALWSTHQGYRTDYLGPGQDINQLAQELDARLLKPAQTPNDIAVYENAEQYWLLTHQQGLQILPLPRHALYTIDIHFLAQTPDGPAIEVTVRNQASGESASWHGAVSRSSDGQIWLAGQLLGEGVMPPLPFDELSFTDHAYFRDLLYQSWQHAWPKLLQQIATSQSAPQAGPQHEARYQALMRYEIARLLHLLSSSELCLIKQALAPCSFADPSDCRGLWLKLEHWWLADAATEDISLLLEKVRHLDYAQELALVAWLEQQTGQR